MKRQSRLSLTLGGAILVGGFIGMVVLFQFREPPAEASTGIEDRRLEVQVAIAEPDTHGVEIEGFGTARAAKSVNMSPEVSGRVVYASPALRVGAHVEQGELLLRIDSARYESMVAERDAEIGRIEAEIERLKATAESDQGRVAVMERSRELARAQFERARVLLEEHVGNQLDVDRSEQSYNDATDRLRQLAQHVVLSKQLSGFLRFKERQGVGGRFEVRQTAFGSFFVPGLGIAIAIKDDCFAFRVDGFYEFLNRGAHFFRRRRLLAFEEGRAVVKRLGHNRIECDERSGDRLAGTDRTELETVTGKRHRAGPVTVAGVARNRREHVHADVHGLLLRAERFPFGDGFQDLGEFVAQEDRQDRGGGFVGAEAMIVRGGCDNGSAQNTRN
mgnify:CR=1 FL=1